MKKAFNNFIIFAGVIIVFCGCSSNTTTKNSEVNSDSLFSEIAAPLQVFSINSTRDTTIIGVKGTKITIPKEVFSFADGTTANGLISVELREFYTISNMFLSCLSTVSDKAILETGGMIYLNSKLNNDNLKIKNGSEITIEMPSKKQAGMEIFYGSKNEDGNIHWVRKDEQNSNNIVAPDTIPFAENTPLNNVLRTINLGWINCDKFSNFESTTDLVVKFKNVPETRLFVSVILKKYNGLIPSIMREGEEVKFSPIPLNEPVYIVAAGYLSEKYYLGIKEVTTENKMNYEVEINELSKDEFLAKLEVLNQNRDLALQ